MDEIAISFSLAELNAIRQMIHFAVQAKGMEVAEAGVLLNRKISIAIEAAQKAQREAA